MHACASVHFPLAKEKVKRKKITFEEINLINEDLGQREIIKMVYDKKD